ncbi:AA10 family lytic polysaccharide monooxygenase CBP21-like [Augochlora pura]
MHVARRRRQATFVALPKNETLFLEDLATEWGKHICFLIVCFAMIAVVAGGALNVDQHSAIYGSNPHATSKSTEESFYHGYVSFPESRALLCKRRVNKGCGAIQYEPQSVEGRKGFPYSPNSPPDGKIASGANSQFPELNQYGKDRWVSVNFPTLARWNRTHVYFNYTWTFTTVHSTTSFRMFVANNKYNKEEPLTRKHLDLNPICEFNFDGHKPPQVLTFGCAISNRKFLEMGQLTEMLMLSVWDIHDTGNAFYQVIDLLPIRECVIFDSIQGKYEEDAAIEKNFYSNYVPNELFE